MFYFSPPHNGKDPPRTGFEGFHETDKAHQTEDGPQAQCGPQGMNPQFGGCYSFPSSVSLGGGALLQNGLVIF